jgi:HNH endonuclease
MTPEIEQEIISDKQNNLKWDEIAERNKTSITTIHRVLKRNGIQLSHGRPIRERILNSVTKIPDGCWIWTGVLNKTGKYGVISVNSKKVYAHVASYVEFIGEKPEGLELDHLCRNRSCVNPEHLEPVTNKTNVLRGVGPTAINAKKTHCIHGHLLSGYNLIENKKGNRACRECKNRVRREEYQRIKSRERNG